MKRHVYFLILILSLNWLSCSEEEWLKEQAYGFYSAGNSYVNQDQFHAAVVRLYEMIEPFYSYWPPYQGNVAHYTSDIAYDAIAITHQMNSYDDVLVPEYDMVATMWKSYYRSIYDANVIINRIDGEDVVFRSESERLRLKAEATFFRAYAYRFLGILYGGVPLVLEEINDAKRDFVRATEQEVWDQVVEDLLFAKQHLPSVTELDKDGRLTKDVVSHLLTEIYIIRREYDKAIASASEVIDNPNYALMTDRFGTHADKPGDPYSDLFRRGNQNRRGGTNMESLWVKQYEYRTEGADRPYRMTWSLVPNYSLLKDNDGKSLFIGPTNQNGGAGAGWMVASDYLLYDVWEGEPSDIRNSEYNIIRDIVADNPASAYYGQKIVESGAFTSFPNTLNRWWSAIFAKVTPIGDFPDEVILDRETGLVSSAAESTFKDEYIFRLAETYLLRAEAHLGKGDLVSAAADINVVRTRANASPISPDDVDIDFILDERARELHFEEQRILTLMRTDKLIEKVKDRNPMYNGKYANHGVSPKHRHWPIPQSEIERNTEAVLEQNPGY